MKKFFPIASAIALLALAEPAAAQQSFAPDSAVRAILADRIAAKRGTGFVVAILERGQPPRIHTAGTTGVEGLALDANSVFEIGSITKVFTTTLLAEMVDRGEVKLDDPISMYLPRRVRVPTRAERQITLLDLATQTSGLPRLPTNLRPASVANPYAGYTVSDLYDFLSGYRLTRDIGSQYEYSNLGIGLLGHLLSLKAGRPYEDLLRERVLAPLGMTATGIKLDSAMTARRTRGFNAQGEPVTGWDFDVIASAGALRSTAADMLKFLAANLDSASSPLGPVLATTRVAQRDADRPQNHIGLGWHIVEAFGTTITWHNGGTAGYRAFIGLDERRNRGVIVLSNSTITPDDIGFHLLEPTVPLDLPPRPPETRKEVRLEPSKLVPLVGVYELAPAFRLTITREGASLFGQATGQQRVQLHAESDLKFFLRTVDAQVTFVMGDDGKVDQLILHQGGSNIPGRRVE